MTESNIPKLVRKQKTIILYMEFHISQANMSRLAREMRNGCGLETEPKRRNYYEI